MEKEFKLNVYFDNEGDELESIISFFLINMLNEKRSS